MLLEILGALECLPTEFALVRFERHMHPNVGSNVVAFDSGRPASTPRTSQAQVVCALSPNVHIAKVVLIMIPVSNVLET
jgi:hypothetical protein